MKLKKLKFESYIKIIKNSVGAKVWRNFYVSDGKRKFDLYENGNLSCAFFVSSILMWFELIDASHATVDSTVKAMVKKGWKKRRTARPRLGDVIVWEKIKYDNGDWHKHIGFYMGNSKAISHRDNKRVPIVHDYKYNGKRKIIGVFFWPKI